MSARRFQGAQWRAVVLLLVLFASFGKPALAQPACNNSNGNSAVPSCRCNINAPSTRTVLGGGTNGVDLLVDQQAGNAMTLGTFTRPDTGSGVVQLQPNGTRVLPPTLIIQSDTLNPSRMPRVAILEVTGGANCKFRIDVDGFTGALFTPQFLADPGFAALSSPNVGATSRLNASGLHRFAMGISATVDASPSQTVFGNVVVRVTYAD